MKNILLSLCCITLFQASKAQYCSVGNRFTETPFFVASEIDSAMDVVYGTALNWQGQPESLTANFYFPKLSVDSMAARPFIMLVHGGSFLGGTAKGLNFDCMEFAKRGFVAATLNYRLGWAAAANCNGDTTSMSLAIYRSIQDAHAALRFAVANAAQYGIDTAWMFAGGNSAGAFTTANLAFVNQAEFNARAPFCQQTLGNLDTSGNSLTTSFTIKGLFHNWGAIIDIDFLKAADAIPMISFTGELDNISQTDSGHYADCLNYPYLWGSRSIYNKLVSLGACANLTVVLGGGHGVYKDTHEQDLFRIQKASCFFKSLFCHTCTSFYTTDSIPADCSARVNSTNHVEEENTARIYPNPFSRETAIYADHFLRDASLILYNCLGQVAKQLPHLSGQTITLERDNLLPGLYFLHLTESNQKIAAKRIIITD